MGVTLTGGGALSWFKKQLCQDLQASRDKSVYQILDGEAAAVKPGSEGLFFLPYLAGERTPHADPDARGCWIGLTLAHTRGHMIRSLMEGVTMAMRDTIDIIRELQVPVNEVRATGGGAASPLWLQMQADLFGYKISTINSAQGPALGVALLAGVGAGHWKNIVEATTAVIKTTGTSRPNAATSRRYEQVCPIFRGLYQSLKGDFKKISAAGS
jgi:xylulokinase